MGDRIERLLVKFGGKKVWVPPHPSVTKDGKPYNVDGYWRTNSASAGSAVDKIIRAYGNPRPRPEENEVTRPAEDLTAQTDETYTRSSGRPDAPRFEIVHGVVYVDDKRVGTVNEMGEANFDTSFKLADLADTLREFGLEIDDGDVDADDIDQGERVAKEFEARWRSTAGKNPTDELEDAVDVEAVAAKIADDNYIDYSLRTSPSTRPTWVDDDIEFDLSSPEGERATVQYQAALAYLAEDPENLNDHWKLAVSDKSMQNMMRRFREDDPSFDMAIAYEDFTDEAVDAFADDMGLRRLGTTPGVRKRLRENMRVISRDADAKMFKNGDSHGLDDQGEPMEFGDDEDRSPRDYMG